MICISSILKCQNKLEGLFYNFEISWKMKKRWAMTILQCQETSNIFNCKIIVCFFEKIAHSKIGLRGVVWCISSTLFCDKSHFGGDHLWLCWLIGHASHFGCTAKIYGKISKVKIVNISFSFLWEKWCYLFAIGGQFFISHGVVTL